MSGKTLATEASNRKSSGLRSVANRRSVSCSGAPDLPLLIAVLFGTCGWGQVRGRGPLAAYTPVLVIYQDTPKGWIDIGGDGKVAVLAHSVQLRGLSGHPEAFAGLDMNSLEVADRHMVLVFSMINAAGGL